MRSTQELHAFTKTGRNTQGRHNVAQYLRNELIIPVSQPWSQTPDDKLDKPHTRRQAEV